MKWFNSMTLCPSPSLIGVVHPLGHCFLFLVSDTGYFDTSRSSVVNREMVSCYTDQYVPGEAQYTDDHVPVRNEGYKPRLCVLCQQYKVTTKSGWGAYSRFKCKVCDVSLCIGKRNCFRHFHEKQF